MNQLLTNSQQNFVLIPKDLYPSLHSSPVRFAVRLRNGLAGSMWKIEARGKGDVYIIPRDIMEDVKISLHASGQQHIKVERPPWDKRIWKEPPQESPLLASVKLIFPVWSAGTGPTKDYNAKKLQNQWWQNLVIIEGDDDENSVITVCFFLTPPNVSVELPEWPPMVRFATLPVGANKDLHIIARKEHRPNLRDAIEMRLAETITNGTVAACRPIGHKSLMLINGDDLDGRPYVTPVSVQMTEQGLKLLQYRRATVELPKIIPRP